MRDTLLEGNTAYKRGGGVAVLLNNGHSDGLLSSRYEILLQNCTFNGNTAGSKGGGVYAGENNFIEIENCHFLQNTAIEEGGGLHADASNTVYLSSCVFVSNSALENGGGISSSSGNKFLFTFSLAMTGNHAGLMGGEMYVNYNSDVSFTGQVSFDSNSAHAGGAVSFQNSMLWSSYENTMIMKSNTAMRGSAVALAYCPVSSSRVLANISFTQNVASVGGTVFWVNDEVMVLEPLGLSSSSLLWENNVAGYGNQTATQATVLVGPESYLATKYDDALDPPLTYTLFDYYNNKVENDTDDLLQIALSSSACGEERAFLSGTDTLAAGLKLQNGMASFATLKAFCNPLGNLTVNVAAEMILFGALSHSVSALTTIHFRACEVGEELVGGNCVQCPTGSFSVKVGGACSECISHDGIEACQGKEMSLKKGYWRRYESSSEVLQCVEEESCAGGTSVGDQLCSTGYEGPLCAVCQGNFYASHGECKKCSPVSIFKGVSLLIYLFAFVVFLSVIVYVIYARNKEVVFELLLRKKGNVVNVNEDVMSDESAIAVNAKIDRDEDDGRGGIPLAKLSDSARARLSKDEEDEEEEEEVFLKRGREDSVDEGLPEQQCNRGPSRVSPSHGDDSSMSKHNSEENFKCDEDVSVLRLAWLWLRMNYLSLTAKLKITIATYQVVNGTSSTLAVILPINFTSFMSALDFINIDLGSALPWNCVNDVDFIDFMVLMTLLPVAISMCIVIMYGIEYQFLRSRSLSREGVGSKYLLAFLWLTYLVLPFITTTIFSMFICTNIDPDDEDNDLSDTYLSVDMQISCESDRYKFGLLYACFMIVLYPFGVLLFYTCMLYSFKGAIMNRNDETFQPMSSSTIVPTSEHMITEGVMGVAAGNCHGITPQTARLAFLWAAYKPKFWYFEIVETSRRMILTAVLSIISPGTSGQIVLAFLVSIFYVSLYRRLSPYVETFDNEMANVGMIQISATFFAALIVSETLLPRSYDFVVDVSLIAANIAVALAGLYFTVMECQEDIGIFSELGDLPPRDDVHVGDGDAESSQSHSEQLKHTQADAGNASKTSAAQVTRKASVYVGTRRASSVSLNAASTNEFEAAIKKHQGSKISAFPEARTS